jgi:hypothetical protein
MLCMLALVAVSLLAPAAVMADGPSASNSQYVDPLAGQGGPATSTQAAPAPKPAHRSVSTNPAATSPSASPSVASPSATSVVPAATAPSAPTPARSAAQRHHVTNQPALHTFVIRVEAEISHSTLALVGRVGRVLVPARPGAVVAP